MRINKYLAHQGYSTRKDADKLIQKKLVFINGKMAVLGDKIKEGDKVEVKSKGSPRKYSYFAYNKPSGIITHSPQMDEKDIEHSINIKGQYVFPVGRLDKDSNGLMILTNDGRITDRLLNPKYVHDKEYVVAVRNKLRPSFKENIEKGVDIEGYMTKKCKVKILNDYTFKITLTEGKKHQIRRMCAALHNDVTDLTRTRVMNINLGKLPPNSHREIVGQELEEFLSELGL